MIALPRTRDFSASNWQRFLAKQQPEGGPLSGVYMMLMFFRAEQTVDPTKGEDRFPDQVDMRQSVNNES